MKETIRITATDRNGRRLEVVEIPGSIYNRSIGEAKEELYRRHPGSYTFINLPQQAQ